MEREKAYHVKKFESLLSAMEYIANTGRDPDESEASEAEASVEEIQQALEALNLAHLDARDTTSENASTTSDPAATVMETKAPRAPPTVRAQQATASPTTSGSDSETESESESEAVWSPVPASAPLGGTRTPSQPAQPPPSANTVPQARHPSGQPPTTSQQPRALPQPPAPRQNKATPAQSRTRTSARKPTVQAPTGQQSEHPTQVPPALVQQQPGTVSASPPPTTPSRRSAIVGNKVRFADTFEGKGEGGAPTNGSDASLRNEGSDVFVQPLRPPPDHGKSCIP